MDEDQDGVEEGGAGGTGETASYRDGEDERDMREDSTEEGEGDPGPYTNDDRSQWAEDEEMDEGDQIRSGQDMSLHVCTCIRSVVSQFKVSYVWNPKQNIPNPFEIEGLELSDEDEELEDPDAGSDPDDESSSDEEDDSSIESIRIMEQFIAEISSATYASSKLDAKTIECLKNPLHDISALDDPDKRLSLKLFLASSKMSQETYNDVRKAIMERHPETKILSYYLVKKLAADMTGISSISDDMCVNSCLAFTGPFKNLDHCPTCNEARRDAREKPRVSPEGAKAMRYRDARTAEIIDKLNTLENPVYDDIFCGKDFLDLHERLELTEDDTTVALSIDGAQLYQNKKSVLD